MVRLLPHVCRQFQTALSVLTQPWSALVLTVLQDGPLRYRALAARMSVVGDRMLSLRLKDLERRGLIERRVLPGRPPGVEYRLTESGRGFRRVAKAIETWAHEMAAAAPHRPAAGTGARSR